jgi:hypothetical protein
MIKRQTKSTHNIAIIYLDEIHHVNHFISVAAELSKTTNVTVLTHTNCQPYFFETLALFKNHNVKVEQLPTSLFRTFTDKLKKRELPRKGFWLKKNMRDILNFDAIIFTDFYHRYVKEARENNPYPKMILINHGTPGRGYAFKKDVTDFDFQLLIGQFQYKQFSDLNLLSEYYKITGYPKIDAIISNSNRNLFNNDKPVVLYTPHFSPPHSSWHMFGLNVLDFFHNQNKYNLIFAPHINLFQSNENSQNQEFLDKYKQNDNIIIDIGSNESVNMTYVLNSDIYLGDVSSQVYEFLLKPRPCIFINAANVDYNHNFEFRFWQCGDVISDLKNLNKNLDLSETSHKSYKSIQEKITADNYYTEEGSSATERTAQAIIEFLNQSTP